MEVDSMGTVAPDSLLNKHNIDIISADFSGLNFKLSMETFLNTRNLRQALNNYAVV
jgi:hypothetical protein